MGIAHITSLQSLHQLCEFSLQDNKTASQHTIQYRFCCMLYATLAFERWAGGGEPQGGACTVGSSDMTGITA